MTNSCGRKASQSGEFCLSGSHNKELCEPFVRALYGNCGAGSSSAWPGKDTHDVRSPPTRSPWPTPSGGAQERKLGGVLALAWTRRSLPVVIWSSPTLRQVPSPSYSYRAPSDKPLMSCRDVPSGDLLLEDWLPARPAKNEWRAATATIWALRARFSWRSRPSCRVMR